MKLKNLFSRHKDEAEVVAVFGQAQLVRYPDGTLELKGGGNEDRGAAKEWMALFWHEAVLKDGGRPLA